MDPVREESKFLFREVGISSYIAVLAIRRIVWRRR
jgi:hypothetical protein